MERVMDSEMIERCAKAACDCSGKLSISDAMLIAIIKAMREPTENMKIAGSIDPGSGGPDEGYETEVWQAMLDAVIGEE